MEEKELIQLWMANGFVHSDGDQGDLFLAGCLVFKELAWRSFFQDIKINTKRERTCKMHDLMHDLAMSVIGHETYCVEKHAQLEKVPKSVRHLSFFGVYLESELKLISDGSLRSLVHLVTSRKIFSSLLSKQQRIRALNRTPWLTTRLLSSICKLEHLRYLYMSCHNIKRLPESLTCLSNLQTLNFWYSGNLVMLPQNLKRMKNLWFLEMDDFDALRSTPPGLGELTCLQRLSIFIVGEDASQHIDQLKELNLGGELTVKQLNNVRNLEEAKSANLKEKKNLTNLSLFWNTKDNEGKSPNYFEEVLQGLEPPHENLERICIEHCQGFTFPNWMSDMVAFEKREEIILEDWPKCDHLPTMGTLSCLRNLILRNMDSVRRSGAEWHGDAECPFPALTFLKLDCFSNLKEWSVANLGNNFPCLSVLYITSCHKLDILPMLPSLRRLYILECNEALVSSATCLTTLEELHIQKVKIRALPHTLRSLSSLKVLNLWACNDLESFPTSLLDGLASLRTLVFSWCEKLKPFGGPLNCDIALQYLMIRGLPEFEYFPEGMQQFNSLSTLEIFMCENLKSIPTWFPSLKSLRKLNICRCAQLKERCDGPDGEDWPKISHIPLIKLNVRTIQNLDEEAI